MYTCTLIVANQRTAPITTATQKRQWRTLSMGNATALMQRLTISETAMPVRNGKVIIRPKNTTCPIANADTIRTSIQTALFALSFISPTFHLCPPMFAS